MQFPRSFLLFGRGLNKIGMQVPPFLFALLVIDVYFFYDQKPARGMSLLVEVIESKDIAACQFGYSVSGSNHTRYTVLDGLRHRLFFST